MCDIVLNRLINKEINVDLFVEWLTTSENQVEIVNCSKTDFISYFLNFLHEQTHWCKTDTTPQKPNTPKLDSSEKSLKRVNLFSTPKESRLPLDTSYTSPVSPLYSNNKTPLCLGDFIVRKRSSSKKKKPSRRITPTSLQQTPTEFNSFNFQAEVVELTAENANEQRSYLAEERTRIEIPQVALRKPLGFTQTSPVEPQRALVTHQAALDVLVRIYLALIHSQLVLNITSELHFVFLLLLVKPGGSLGVAMLEQATTPREILEPIHNTLYFATRVLEGLEAQLGFLDKPTIKLLGNSLNLQKFAPEFARKLLQIHDEPLTHPLVTLPVSATSSSVCFDLDTDNRRNFPNDVSFHAFRKQRDLFYEILRIWEKGHQLPGWSYQMSLGGKIKSLLGLHVAPMNFVHFARLFKAQLLSTMRVCRKDDNLLDHHALANIDADKLTRLQNRLVTKQSHHNLNSPPLFLGHQEFYKDFILVASNHMFNKHLSDCLIAEILELNSMKFGGTELKPQDKQVDPSTRLAFLQCVKSTRLLSKFLGFVEALPYQDSLELEQSWCKVRESTQPPVDLLGILVKAQQDCSLVLTVPWMVKFLSMLDYATLRLSYYSKLLEVLYGIYRNPSRELPLYNQTFLKLLIGYLFELPHFPHSDYFTYSNSTTLTTPTNQNPRLDHLEVIDQLVLYEVCPFLHELKRVLQMSGTIRHITPVTAAHSSNDMARRRLELDLEEAFLNGQAISIRKTVEFVSERVASSCVKHICNVVVPGEKTREVQKVLDELQLQLECLQDENIKSKSAELALGSLASLRAKCQLQLTNITSSRIPTAIDSLLPLDVLEQTRNVCVNLAQKQCTNRVELWLEAHVTAALFSKTYEMELGRLVTGRLKRPLYSRTVFALPPGGRSDRHHNEGSLSAVHLLDQLKELCVEVLEEPTGITWEIVEGITKSTKETLEKRADVNETISAYICSTLLDFYLLIIIHHPKLPLIQTIQPHLTTIFQHHHTQPDLFKNLLSPRNIHMLQLAPTTSISWVALAQFCAFLIDHQLLTCDAFEMQCIGLFKRNWDEGTLKGVAGFLREFVQRRRGSSERFAMVLDWMSDYCVDL